MTVTGTVVDGRGFASGDMRRTQFDPDPLGYQPVPGTLNLQVPAGTVARLGEPPIRVQFARLDWWVWPARVGTVDCHLMHPNLQPHGPEQAVKVELIAPVRLRDALQVVNGDSVEVTCG